MALEFKLPDLGEGLVEGEIRQWLVKPGDAVKTDQSVVKVETAKAVVELPAPRDGVVLELRAKEGETVKVGQVIYVLGEPGEKAPAAPAPTTTEKPPTPTTPAAAAVVGKLEVGEEVISERRAEARAAPAAAGVKATPFVRKLAQTLGVDIARLKGTGQEGRVTEDDVKKAAQMHAAPPMPAAAPAAPRAVKKYDKWGYIDHVPLKGVRRAVAEHMREAWTHPVPVTTMDEADVTDLVRVREKEKKVAEKGGIHLTYLPFIIKALIPALKEFPFMNASMDEEADEIILKKYYNIGVAVDTGEGLLVPVIKGADQKSILQLAKETRELAEKARARTIDLADMRGSTFSLTNYGSIGGTYATPIINYPDMSILGIGRIKELPRYIDGKLEPRKILHLSLTFDHRIADGAYAAAFLNRLIEHLEDPELMLVEG
jgi:pyruvate dehydrogenase E2 component (dihydrolipoamide acetyltransferase)